MDQKPQLSIKRKIKSEKGHNSVKTLRIIPLFKLCLYFMMPDPSVKYE